MALTINRKNEVNEKEFARLKTRFKKNSNSQAIYAAVKFIVNELPEIEQKHEELMSEFEKVYKNYTELTNAIKQKSLIEKKIEDIISNGFNNND